MAVSTIDPNGLNIGQIGGTRNRIMNGAMVIDQRNGGSSVTPTASSYTLDRFRLEISQASKLSVEQNAGSVTPPEGFTNYLGITSTSAYSVLTGDFFLLSQRIEGFNVADLGWGTSDAKSVTLSFRVRSSLTGSFGGVLTNSAQDRSYPFTYSIAAADTWTTIEITIAGDTTGTWLTNNGVGLFVYFGLGVGTTYGSGTAGAWAAGNIFAPTGSTSVVGTSGATFYITGVQLEVGDTATPFEHRSYGQELALCQRYYYKLQPPLTSTPFCVGFARSTTSVRGVTQFPVSMRTRPTALEQSGNSAHYSIEYKTTGVLCTAVPVYGNASTEFAATTWTASGLTAGEGLFGRNDNVAAFLAWSAEL